MTWLVSWPRCAVSPPGPLPLGLELRQRHCGLHSFCSEVPAAGVETKAVTCFKGDRITRGRWEADGGKKSCMGGRVRRCAEYSLSFRVEGDGI